MRRAARAKAVAISAQADQTAVAERLWRWLLLILAAIVALALWQRTVSAHQPQTQQESFLLHLNGIGGERACDHWLINGLKQGGIGAEAQLYDWTHGDDGLPALQAYKRNQEEARKIAAMIAEQCRAHPGRTIYLTCHSAGAGLAVWALEALPEEVQVDTVAMFAPALSPGYDLSKALRHVRRKLYVFSSPHDSLVLGTGTKLFGTVDGVKTEAAGLNGFVKPDSADAQQYAKVDARPYQKQWLGQFGNAGSHICGLRTAFARGFVAPLLLESLNSAPTTQPAQAAQGHMQLPANATP